MSILIKILMLSVPTLISQVSFAPPVDFSGNWKTPDAVSDFFPETSPDSIPFYSCRLECQIAQQNRVLQLKLLSVECEAPDGLIFQNSIPALNLKIAEDGAIYDETGWVGRLKGSAITLEYVDGYDGVHYMYFELSKTGGLELDWKYQGSVSGSFHVSHGKDPLTRIGVSPGCFAKTPH